MKIIKLTKRQLLEAQSGIMPSFDNPYSEPHDKISAGGYINGNDGEIEPSDPTRTKTDDTAGALTQQQFRLLGGYRSFPYHNQITDYNPFDITDHSGFEPEMYDDYDGFDISGDSIDYDKVAYNEGRLKKKVGISEWGEHKSEKKCPMNKTFTSKKYSVLSKNPLEGNRDNSDVEDTTANFYRDATKGTYREDNINNGDNSTDLQTVPQSVIHPLNILIGQVNNDGLSELQQNELLMLFNRSMSGNSNFKRFRMTKTNLPQSILYRLRNLVNAIDKGSMNNKQKMQVLNKLCERLSVENVPNSILKKLRQGIINNKDNSNSANKYIATKV